MTTNTARLRTSAATNWENKLASSSISNFSILTCAVYQLAKKYKIFLILKLSLTIIIWSTIASSRSRRKTSKTFGPLTQRSFNVYVPKPPSILSKLRKSKSATAVNKNTTLTASGVPKKGSSCFSALSAIWNFVRHKKKLSKFYLAGTYPFWKNRKSSIKSVSLLTRIN